MATPGEIVALEGVCCAGKTTLIKSMSKELGAGVIPELPEFGRNLFLPFNGRESIARNSQDSIPIEKVRVTAAVGLSAIASHVIMDRSFFSTLALGYGAVDITGPEAYRKLVDSVVDMMRTGEMPLPDKVLCVKVDVNTVKQRNQSRTPPLDDYWIDGSRITRQNEFYSGLQGLPGVAMVNGNADRESVLNGCLGTVRLAGSLSLRETVESIEGFRDTVL